MKKALIFLILFGFIGLIIGYLFYGKIAGEYVSLKAIFGASTNSLQSLGRKVSGLQQIKQDIIISGVIGATIGVIIAIVKKK